MPEINKKYIEDFETLVRDFEKLKTSPNPEYLSKVMEDLQQVHTDLSNIQL